MLQQYCVPNTTTDNINNKRIQNLSFNLFQNRTQMLFPRSGQETQESNRGFQSCYTTWSLSQNRTQYVVC